MDEQSYNTSLTQVDNYSPNEAKNENSVKMITNPLEIVWQNLIIEATIQEDKNVGGQNKKVQTTKTLINCLDGVIRPGSFTAIMGPSGSGKTTLLNFLSGRLNSDNMTIYGELMINGQKTNDLSPYGYQMAYVMQDDILLPTYTPRESFMFAANLRLKGLTEQQKIKRVDELIVDLGLERCADTIIGNNLIKGISGGERKRTSIGVELLSNPSLIFLDEPTTGLDSSTALQVIEALKNLAQQGVNVVSTIHQPSSDIYLEFDRLILLVQGNIIFQSQASEAVPFFANQGFQCPDMSNPADYLTQLMNEQGLLIQKMQQGEVEFDDDQIKEEFQQRLINFVQNYKDSPQYGQLEPRCNSPLNISRTDFNVSAFIQFKLIYMRSFQNLLRNPMDFRLQFVQSIFMSLAAILVFNNLGTGIQGLQTTDGALFFLTTAASMNGVQGSVATFASEKPLFMRERLNQSYTVAPYFWGQSLAQFPFQLVYPAVIGGITYYSIGLNDETKRFFIFLLILEACFFYSSAYGMFISCVIPNLDLAMALFPVTVIPLMILGGLYISANQIPFYFYEFQYLSMFQYGYQALFLNQYDTDNPLDKAWVAQQDYQLTIYDNILILIGLGVLFRIISVVAMMIFSRPRKIQLKSPKGLKQ